MKTPIDSVERITQRLPDGGSRFLLCDAVAAMQEAYERDRLDGCNENDDRLMLGAVTNTCFEVGIFRQFTGGGNHVPTQLEVSLKYPINLRCGPFREYIRYCESVSDSTEFFSSFRSSLLYRMYSSTNPVTCVVKWHDEKAFVSVASKVMPALAEEFDTDWYRDIIHRWRRSK